MEVIIYNQTPNTPSVWNLDAKHCKLFCCYHS